MSSFTSPLIVTPVDAKYWKLVEQFTYHIGDRDSKEVIVVPVGFVTDFASIPQLFWSIIPPWGQYGKAAVVHDFLYKSQILTKKQSDSVFLEGMEILGVSKIKRTIIYKAVDIFGFIAWNSLKKTPECAKLNALHKVLVVDYWDKKTIYKF